MSPRFFPNDEITYINSPYVKENTFIGREPEDAPLPLYSKIKNQLPVPVWDGHDDVIACYNKAWEIAFGNLRKPCAGSGFVNNLIDTAFNGCTFMWDSSFILMFGKYGARVFNFQNTLNNFYARQHSDGFISREICEEDGSEKFTRFDPASTGPNVMPWCEWEYYLNTGDIKRVSEVFPVLLAYHKWLKDNHTWTDGTYWSSGWGCGMDNQPRMMPGYNVMFSNGHMVWADACFQMLLSGEILIKMGKLLGREKDTEFLDEEQENLKKTVNEKLWDNNTCFYYDLWKNGDLNMVKSVGAYWALLAGVVPKDRADSFVAHLENKDEFNRSHRPPTLSADNPHYDPHGSYWCGSVWAPTTYMVLRGLEKYGFNQTAYDIACSNIKNVVAVFNKTGTLWENYAPDFAERGNESKGDFVGWSGLFPITILFEFVFGIKPNAAENKITWYINRTEKHGVKNYPLGNDAVLDLICEARGSSDEKPVISVKTNVPVTVEIIYGGKSETLRFNAD
ncbi:MAG: trehalase family glycosidase [Firmicutes bacterium]|nr:trehalase family glycosidase [Bacillota bacterium]